jgi:hypothetical protein
VDSLAALPGYHITVETAVSGMSRSRSCSGKRWTLAAPQRSFSTVCHAYTLKSAGSDDLFVEIHDSAIAEEASADGSTRAVTFVTPEIATVLLDGLPADLGAAGPRRFAALELGGPNFTVRYAGEGTLSVAGASVTARLLP